jgi:septum formation protein
VLIQTGSPLVLGSASPRRREILTRLGVAHVVVAAEADETVRAGEEVAAYLDRVVRLKLDHVRAAIPEELAARAPAVLVADTSVVLGADILGKPADADEAYAMIARLAGRTHEVHTRFAIARPAPGAPVDHVETATTAVTFRRLPEAKARAYASSGEGKDKAGGYAVQGYAAGFVARIAGSYTNVVGLPACEVVVALEQLGLL